MTLLKHKAMRVIFPSLVQLIAITLPFLFLKLLLNDGGKIEIVNVEFLLSITGISTIIIDWSSATFLSRYGKLITSRGAYTTILALRFLLALCVALLYLGLALITKDMSRINTLSLAIILAGICLDPTWIYIGKLKVATPSVINMVRFTTAIALTLLGSDAQLAIAIGYMLASLAALTAIIDTRFLTTRISLPIAKTILKRNFLPTLTEAMTAAFTRLDVMLAVFILPVDQAFIYAIGRKLVTGAQSVLFASARLFYVDRTPDSNRTYRNTLRNIILIATIISPAAAMLISQRFFGIQLRGTAALSFLLFFSLLPLGFVKTLLQFTKVYVEKLFRLDLLGTGIGFAAYFSLALLSPQFGKWAILYLIACRVFAELTYIVVIPLALKSRHA